MKLKTLYFAGMELQAEKIVKGKDYIIGYTDGYEVFSLRGITDFSQYTLGEGEEFDVPDLTEMEQLKLDFSKSNAEILDIVLSLLPLPTGGN